MACSVDEAEALERDLNEQDVAAVVDHPRRLEARYRAVARWVREQTFGRLESVHVLFSGHVDAHRAHTRGTCCWTGAARGRVSMRHWIRLRTKRPRAGTSTSVPRPTLRDTWRPSATASRIAAAGHASSSRAASRRSSLAARSGTSCFSAIWCAHAAACASATTSGRRSHRAEPAVQRVPRARPVRSIAAHADR